MTWTTPNTSRAAASTITSTIYNTELTGNLQHLGVLDFINATASSVTAVASGAFTLVAFDAEIEKTGTITHDNVTNNSRVTVATAGLYTITVTTGWTANTTGMRGTMVRKNAAGSAAGGTLLRTMHQATTTAQSCQTILTYTVRLSAADYVEAFRYQSSGAGLAPLSLDGSPAYITVMRNGA